jgi:hypothetical protein
LQILINASITSLEAFKRATGVEFKHLELTSDRDAVAVVVQGSSFEKDISIALQLGVPVVVIAGNDMKCVEQATKNFIPDSCILVKQGNDVVTADGKRIANTVGGGIGVRAVVKAATYAYQNKLCPEPLIWIESEPIIEPVLNTTAAMSDNPPILKSKHLPTLLMNQPLYQVLIQHIFLLLLHPGQRTGYQLLDAE